MNAPGPSATDLALEALGGAVVVLDARLDVERCSPSGAELFGGIEQSADLRDALAPGVAVVLSLTNGVTIVPVGRQPGGVTIVPVGRQPGGVTISAAPLPGGGWVLRLTPTAEGLGGVLNPDPDPVCFHGMWTQDPGMKAVFRILERVAQEDVSVLVRGETGAGKELAAQALHALSPRSGGPFRAINCAALPANLLESELFGHSRGAFTGAVKDNPGHFQLAHRGTLFLDEVAELPLELQAKLLRVLETGTVLPVGAQRPVPVDVRIVSATHRALRQEVEHGHFRADLMFRLRVVPVYLPPLRERRGDIPLLVRTHIDTLNRRGRRQIAEVSRAAMAVLLRHDYPGNVRELRNFIAYAFAIGEGPTLRPNELPPELHDLRFSERETAPSPAAPPAPQSADDRERERIREALSQTGGRKTEAAQLLGLSRVTLWRRIKALGLPA